LFWHDYIINISSFSSFEWISKLIVVVVGFCFDIFASENNLNSTFSSHNSYFSSWPGIIGITSQLFT
jgi:hypothetical protein